MFAAIFLAALPMLAPVAPVIPVLPPARSCWAKTEIAAIMTVAEKARQLTEDTDWEWGGLIYRLPSGKLCASFPVTNQQHTRFVVFTNMLPEGTSLAGVYHTHTGRLVSSQYFSGTDALNMCLHNVSSFLVTVNGMILRLSPSDSICGARHIDGWHNGTLVGTITTKVPPRTITINASPQAK